MRENDRASRIDRNAIIGVSDALRQFESFGRSLTIFSPFGEDPLRNRVELVNRREAEFKERYPDFGRFFYRVVNGDNSLFREGILFLIDLSKRLEMST